VSVSGFPVSLFDRLSFSISAFLVAPVLTRTNRVLEVVVLLVYIILCDILLSSLQCDGEQVR